MKKLKRIVAFTILMLAVLIAFAAVFRAEVIVGFKNTLVSKLDSKPEAKSTSPATHQCDIEAAHVSDPLRYAQGKDDEEVVGMVAFRACTEAVNQFPNEGRFHFQQGRALRAMNRSEEANREFQTAASLGYESANFYLANTELEAYQQSEDEVHLENARKLLEAAIAFPPAAEQLDKITFSTDGLRHPQIIEALYNEDWDKLQSSRILVIFFLNGMQNTFNNPFNPDGDNCTANMVDVTVKYDLEHGMIGDPSNSVERLLNEGLLKAGSWGGLVILDPAMGGDREKWIAFFEGAGEREARFLAKKYGCHSYVLRRIYRGLLRYARQKRPLSEYGVALLLEGKGAEIFLTPGERITGE